MAEHIRNELARVLSPVRPTRIITFAQFLERTNVPGAAPKPILDSLISGALANLDVPRFRPVAEYRGFRNQLAALLEEVERDMLPPDVARICVEVEHELASRNLALRNARLRAAAQFDCDLPPLIVVDGFFTFSPTELLWIESLAARTSVVVTLPEWPSQTSHRARSRLLAAGLTEVALTIAYRTSAHEIFCAAAIEQETEEITRRILEETARGRQLREIGIVVRTREPYASALATTLARFGIPARFYFADPLRAHPAIDFIGGIVRALLSGWKHTDLLRLMRMPVSGIGATSDGDRFDFEFRELLPGRGLPLRARFRELPPAAEALLDSLAAIHAWLGERLEPVEWASRLKSLRGLLPRPALTANESLSVNELREWTSTAAALDAFDVLLDETARFLNAAPIGLVEFWKQAECALELTELRIPDRRREVVHVLDVFEARQWELPIVFVCGMVERNFPQYHRENPLLDDAGRRRAGLETSVDLQREERALFQLATSRATERTILSYSRYDDRGEATLPSFFLDDILAHASVQHCEMRIRPRPSRFIPQPQPLQLRDPALLDRLASTHRILSPSSIESFVQCPFRFFANRTLRLRERPPAPRDRLTPLLQGSLIHAAIAALEEEPHLGIEVLEQVYAPEAKRLRIPVGYRTAAVWLEMQRNLSTFLAERAVFARHPGWPARVEEQFRIAITPELSVRGRIDRLEIGPNREALVIDYKYSASTRIKELVNNPDAVQAGLYMLAAMKQFGLTPAGMLYCSLKMGVEWGGWHVPIAGLERIGESCTAARLEELTQASEAKAREVFASITSGNIAVQPTDEKKCSWCDYLDICRIETQ